MGLLVAIGKYTFNFVRHCQTIPPACSALTPSHQQQLRIPVAPHPGLYYLVHPHNNTMKLGIMVIIPILQMGEVRPEEMSDPCKVHTSRWQVSLY